MYKQIEVKSVPTWTIVKADGVEVKGLRRIKIEQEVGEEIPSIEMECISHDLDVEINRADIKFTFADNWVDVTKCMPELDESVLAIVQDKYGLHQEVLFRQHFDETDAIYEGDYWCSYRTSNIEALGICKVLAWQELPKYGDYDV